MDDFSERDICTKFILPALTQAGWDVHTQIREEVPFTAGKIIVQGRMHTRGKQKRADFILYYKYPNIPLAVIEAKNQSHSVRAGIQQALDYAQTLDVPFVFSSNGNGFFFHDKTKSSGAIEKEIALAEFPSPDELWNRFREFKGIATEQIQKIVEQDYYIDTSPKQPRYYQVIAINRTVEAIAKGQNRILLVMATGTGKTYVAFQIIWRLWKSGKKKRILFLADRNVLLSQARNNDFKHFKDVMTVVQNHKVDKSYQVYLALYQGLTGNEEERNIYKEFSPDFFDLIVVDECHRGSAADDAAWREILEYFSSATQIGLTATPKEDDKTSNIHYFNEPIYTYSLKQGIEDGFLAPYKVIRVGIDKDLEGWRPERGKTDVEGVEVEDRLYNTKDYDRTLVIEDSYNYMKSGTLLRQVINRINKDISFTTQADRHQFNDIYEQILKDLQSAGNAGEFYTPRAVTQFVVEMVNPKLGETILDPACGTAGFLVNTIEHIGRNEKITTVSAREKLQNSIHGVEKKPLPHMLATTNLILHGIEVPSIDHDNLLMQSLQEWTPERRVDVIVTNPPFGGMEEDGVEKNFPLSYRTRETADLFLYLIMHALKPKGRCGMVLPDGSLFGEGIKTRIKEKLLADCNLHTIVRLPNGVFAPYTGINTNLLFFEKGKPTNEIWYFEHPYPEGIKMYNKTRPIRLEEFDLEKKWWNKRTENEYAWKVSIDTIKERNYNLDVKNPHKQIEEKTYSSSEIINMLNESFHKSEKLLGKLKAELI